MHLHLSVVFVAIFAIITVLSKPLQLRGTNAQRLSRGLPPLRPRKLWASAISSPSIRLYAQPQATESQYEGRLEVRYLDGSTAGYVRNNNRKYINGLNWAFDPDYDLRVSFSTDPDIQETFDLIVTNAMFPGPFYHVGFSVNDLNHVFSPGEGSAAEFGIVGPAPRGSPPQLIPNTSPQLYGESNVWLFVEDTGELVAYYTNPSTLSTIHVPLAFRVGENDLFFTTNVTRWNQEHSGYFANEVKLFLAD